MQAVGFSWKESIYLCVAGVDCDLHNCFDFRSVHYDVAARRVVLEWTRNAGEWVQASQPRGLRLVIEDVASFAWKARDAEMPFTEDDCLCSFGYHSDEPWCEGQFWTDAAPDPAWRWSFFFQSEAELLVQGGDARVVVDP